MRSTAAWEAHPQAIALRALPLVSVRCVGEAPARPVRGARVLDLTRVIAGPIASRALALYGANVLRVGAAHLPEMFPVMVDTGFGKRFTELDLRQAAGCASLLRLVRDADVVVQSYRPGALTSLCFGVEALTAARPGIVCTNISAYGEVGPWAGRRGFDSLVQMSCGIAHEGMLRNGAERPVPLPAQALDHASGWLAALGTLVALRNRARDGGSWRVDVSLARTAMALQDLGFADEAQTNDPTFEDVEDRLATMPSAFGMLTYVLPPGATDGRALAYASPPREPGSDAPYW